MSWLLVFLGGGIGSLLRFAVGRISLSVFPMNFPIGTLIANVISCLIIGLSISYFKHEIDKSTLLYSFLIIGVCGGFSTFSTFSYESLNLFQQGMLVYGILNIVTSVGFCLAILWFILR